MDDTPIPNSQYALQLALQTMKDRCMQLQKRITVLETENLSLKLKQVKSSETLSQDSLEYRLCKVSEEKQQLKNTINMVATENKQMWSNLLQISNENKILGNKISKISDTLSQHVKTHTPLIRSKTFTQEVPHTKHLQRVLAENDKISIELEDISLKLQNSFSKEKNELKLQALELSSLTDDLGFKFLDEEVDDSMINNVEQHLLDLKSIKFILQQHNEALQVSVDHIDTFCADVEVKQLNKKKEPSVSKTIQVNLPLEVETKPVTLNKESDASPIEEDANNERICPICVKKFPGDANFDTFREHVEDHFMDLEMI